MNDLWKCGYCPRSVAESNLKTHLTTHKAVLDDLQRCHTCRLVLPEGVDGFEHRQTQQHRNNRPNRPGTFGCFLLSFVFFCLASRELLCH